MVHDRATQMQTCVGLCEFVLSIQISPPVWHMAAKFGSIFMVNVLQC